MKSFLFAIFLLLLFLLTENILLENLPQFSILWSILIKSLVAEIDIFSRSLRSFMKFSKLINHDFSGYFKIAESFFWTVQHEETASYIVKCCDSINRLYSEKGLSYLSGF